MEFGEREKTRNLVVLPTYNELENIEAMVGALLRSSPGSDILVVDDSSPDGTGGWVANRAKSEPRLHLLRRTSKDGLGPAYIAGFLWGLDAGYDRLVQIDCDFSHDPNDVPRLFEALKTSDIVVGSRYIKGGRTEGWSRVRQLISLGGNWYARAMLRAGVHDMTGGFNGWNRNVLSEIGLGDVQSKGYAFQVELKFRAFLLGFRFSEIPIVFRERSVGASKMSKEIFWEAAFRVLQVAYRSWLNPTPKRITNH